jgi:hypothetical protein
MTITGKRLSQATLSSHTTGGDPAFEALERQETFAHGALLNFPMTWVSIEAIGVFSGLP